MRIITIMTCSAVIGFFSVITAYSGDQIEINVYVVADKVPEQIAIDEESTGQSTALTQVSTSKNYKITMQIPETNELVAPYRLVASWGETKEQLFLGLRPLSPKSKKQNISIYHKNGKCDHQALREIEALGTDYDSVLQRYFRARAYHRMWRFQNNQPEHVVAIRSAKIWFDAAYNLIRLKPIFRMDTEIMDIMNNYEKLAATNPIFGKRYRNYVPMDYVQNINDQVIAMDWAFVRNIPELVTEGELDKAMAQNELARSTLNNKPKEIQQLVGSIQRINIELLDRNSQYINTLKAQIRK